MPLAISCHRSRGKTPYCNQWGVLCKNQWQDMACKNGGYCKLSAGRPPSMVLRGNPFDPVKNSNEKTCYSLEGWENGRKEMAHVCTGWSACSHSLTAAWHCLFKILKEKCIEKVKCLKKVCIPWMGNKCALPHLIAHVSPRERNQEPPPHSYSSPWLTSYPLLQRQAWLSRHERKRTQSCQDAHSQY